MTVLIPAYEPTMKMLKLILKLKEKTSYRILIVDDGSGEEFGNIFRKAEVLGCTVLRHKTNLGKGAALKTGFLRLLTEEVPDDVVCADSDGQHRPDDIIRVAGAIGAKSEMVLGTREFTGKIPLKSRLGNKATALIFKLTTGISLTDTQTGLRAYPARLLDWLRTIEGDRSSMSSTCFWRQKKRDHHPAGDDRDHLREQ
jgi:glycosyltransferase involved in cell wall biosynthesis